MAKTGKFPVLFSRQEGAIFRGNDLDERWSTRGDMLDEEVFKLLEGADWKEVAKELLAFAVNWSRKYPTLGYGEDPRFLALGVSYEDVVQEVIVKAFSGQRTWDPDRVELMPWLKMHVKSIIDALAKSKAANQETTLPGDGEDQDFESGQEYSPAMMKVGTNNQIGTDPEVELLRSEHVEGELGLIRGAIEGDEELELLILAIECGCEPKPRFLAEELRIPVNKVNQQIRRLRRRVNAMRVKNERTEAR